MFCTKMEISLREILVHEGRPEERLNDQEVR